jgi:hypothetical protein
MLDFLDTSSMGVTYLVIPSATGKKDKKGRPKKHKPPSIPAGTLSQNQLDPQNKESEEVHTRLRTGSQSQNNIILHK